MTKPGAEQPQWIDINARLTDEVAWELAQFCKPSMFDQFYALIEAHLPHEERQWKANLVISGVDAVAAALRDKGYAPR